MVTWQRDPATAHGNGTWQRLPGNGTRRWLPSNCVRHPHLTKGPGDGPWQPPPATALATLPGNGTWQQRSAMVPSNGTWQQHPATVPSNWLHPGAAPSNRPWQPSPSNHARQQPPHPRPPPQLLFGLSDYFLTGIGIFGRKTMSPAPLPRPGPTAQLPWGRGPPAPRGGVGGSGGGPQCPPTHPGTSGIR